MALRPCGPVAWLRTVATLCGVQGNRPNRTSHILQPKSRHEPIDDPEEIDYDEYV